MITGQWINIEKTLPEIFQLGKTWVWQFYEEFRWVEKNWIKRKKVNIERKEDIIEYKRKKGRNKVERKIEGERITRKKEERKTEEKWMKKEREGKKKEEKK